MRRAAIFAILAVLLLAVAGVTFAQESPTDNRKSEDVEGTTPEATEPKMARPERTVPERIPDRPRDRGERPAQESNDGPAGGEARGKDEAANSPGRGEEIVAIEGDTGQKKGASQADAETSAEAEGKAEPKGKVEGKGKGKAGSLGKGKKAGDSGVAEDEAGGGQKVTLCHKGKNTLSVGAPAQSAHLRHGDSLGSCG